MNIRLTILLKDGRRLSGVYDYQGVLSQLEYAWTQPEYAGFDLGAGDV